MVVGVVVVFCTVCMADVLYVVGGECCFGAGVGGCWGTGAWGGECFCWVGCSWCVI